MVVPSSDTTLGPTLRRLKFKPVPRNPGRAPVRVVVSPSLLSPVHLMLGLQTRDLVFVLSVWMSNIQNLLLWND